MPAVQERRSSVLLKSIKPKGLILNDNGSGVDHLGTAVYAKAIANQITDVNTPVTFGIFARWGSGKSFLIKHIQSIIRKQDKKNRSKSILKKRKCKSFSLMLSKLICASIIGGTVVVLLMLLVNPTLFGLNTEDKIKITRFGAGCALLVFLAIIGACFLTRVKLYKHGFSKISVLAYARFTKLPILEAEHNIAGVKKESKINLELTGKPGQVDDSETDSTSTEKSIRYIFVNFNAWQYSGSDNLWAGIVLTLAKAVEKEFSSITTRLFRGIILQRITKERRKPNPIIYAKIKHQSHDKVYEIADRYGKVLNCKSCCCCGETKSDWWSIHYSCNSEADLALRMFDRISIAAQRRDPITDKLPKTPKPKKGFYAHFKKYARKHFCLADLYWLLLFIIGAIAIPIVVLVVIQIPSNVTNDQASDTGLVFSQVIVWLPAGVSFIYVIASNAYHMAKSQTDRLVSLLKGIEGNLANELGFMHKVKEEVIRMTDLIHTVEFVYDVKYKVIIAIDDLDRIPLPKIRLVLEAVNILLSDRSSPFVCLIAVDSRIAVESLELPDRFAEQVPRISGHEYLKKIINIPFCLPEITESDKKNYVAGLIDDSDITTRHSRLYQYKDEIQDRHEPMFRDNLVNRRDGVPFDEDFNSVYDSADLSTTHIAMKELAGEEITTRRVARPAKQHDHLQPISETSLTFDMLGPKLKVAPMAGDSQYSTGYVEESYADVNVVNAEKIRTIVLLDECGEHLDTIDPYEDIPFSINQRSSENKTRTTVEKGDEEHIHHTSTYIPNSINQKPIMTGESQSATTSNITEAESNVVEESYDNVNFFNEETHTIPPNECGKHADPIDPYGDIPFSANLTPKDKTTFRPSVPELPPVTILDSKMRLDHFLFHCRRHLLEQFLINHLEGNPRNIKRIFNIISLTALIVGFQQEHELQERELNRIAKMSNSNLMKSSSKTSSPYRKPTHKMDNNLAKDIVTWVLLTDQWPYRSSYLLQVIEDSDQRIDDEESFIPEWRKLYDIYMNFVLDEISIKDHEILNLDGDPDIFRRFLKKQHLCKSTVKSLLKYTINVDQGLRNKVALRRAVCFIEKRKQHQESIPANEKKGGVISSGTTASLPTVSSVNSISKPLVEPIYTSSSNTMPRMGLTEVDTAHKHKLVDVKQPRHPKNKDKKRKETSSATVFFRDPSQPHSSLEQFI